MTQLVAILWVGAVLALLLVARRARAGARTGDGPIPRWTAAAAAAALALLACGGALALAVAPAWSGRRAIESGPADGSGRSPARARLFLHYVQLALPAAPSAIAVGYGPDAPLRLPAVAGAAGALDEAQRGWNLLSVAGRGSGLVLAALPPPEPTPTRVVAAALPGAALDVAALARRADLVARACRPSLPSLSAALPRPMGGPPAAAPPRDLASGEVALAGPGALVAVACSGARPVLALAFSRAPGGAADLVRAVPLVRRGNRFELHHLEIGPRSLVQIGSSSDSAPGVELWEVPAPPGATRLLIPPPDPFAPCARWRASLGEPAAAGAGGGAGARAVGGAGAGAAPGSAAAAAAAASGEGDGEAVCVLPFAAPFALEVRRLLPDTGGLATRSLWAAAMLVLPALGWLVWLAAARRSRLTRARLAEALAASWMALVVAGLSAWRLLWAHRIDMLRDHEAFGWRVVHNQVLVVLVAAALGATCASRAEPGASARRRLLLALGGWSAALLLGAFALGPDRASLASDRAIAGALLSLALGAGPVAAPLLLRRLRAAAAASLPSAAAAAIGRPTTAVTGAAPARGPSDAGRGAARAATAETSAATLRWPPIDARAAAARAATDATDDASRAVTDGGAATDDANAEARTTTAVTASATARWGTIEPGASAERAATDGAAATDDAATDDDATATARTVTAAIDATTATSRAVADGAAATTTTRTVTATDATGAAGRADTAGTIATARTATDDAASEPAAAAGPGTAAATTAAPFSALAAPDLRLAPIAALVAAGAAAAMAAVAAPREPSLKLALAWTIALLFHAALGTAVQPDRVHRRRLYAAAGAGAAAALAALALDPGIATAIVLPGLVFAMLFAAHDASFDDRALRQVGSYRRRHVPLAACHAALVLAIGGAAAVWAASGLVEGGRGGEPGRELTAAAFHLPLLVAGFLAPAAILVARRRGRAAAWPWIVAAGAAAALWMGRGPLLDIVLASDSQAASRIALVSDPGYALLHNPDRFLAGLTAWRETAMPAAASAWTGQGYFGAQLIDPGVLLSVENDYLALLVLRESGAAGLLAPALLLVGAAAGLFLLAGDRFRRGGAPERRRALAALLLGVLAVYQPLAALGALPLTGLPWPGLGIDSPSDFWLLVALFLFVALWGRADDAELDAYDAALRRERRYARLRRAEQAAALLLIAAAVLVLARAAVGAAARPAMLPGTDTALAYARGLSCADGGDGTGDGASVPRDLVGRPADPGSERFHGELRARWQFERARAVAVAARLAARPAQGEAQCAADAGDTGAWRAAPGDAPGECRLLLAAGLPEIELRVSRPSAGEPAHVACSVAPPDETLRRLRLPTERPLEAARVRLVSRAMGAAARDVGELVSGTSVVRLRPGAELVSLVSDRPGLAAAGRVVLGGGAVVRAADEGARLELAADATPGDVMLLVRDPGTSAAWTRAALDRPSTPLDRIALIVLSGRAGSAGGVWLFRPRTEWPGSPDDAGAVVDPILADDTASAAGPTRRAYPYGALLPEIGWVNRFQRRRSLGLDGWVRVAVDELTASRRGAAGSPWSAAPAAAADARCGTLDPPPADPARVCALAADGVIECRVSLQPELAVRMRHLTELISLDPERNVGGGRGFAPPQRASFVLLRGDSGEILADGEFVPGRASSLYAPATAAAELRLIRAREDRDLETGRALPPDERGEASGEKAEWNQPIAIGSALKPLVARAFERADPDLARRIVLRGAPFDGAECRGSRAHALLGHCPPTDTLWNHPEEMRMVDFLALSANWYQGAIGILGTALPDGRIGLGDREVGLDELLSRDVGDHATDAALWTERDGRAIVTASHVIDLDALREAPMWSQLEAVVGRRLCSQGDKAACRRAGDRGDLCAARAMPVARPTADLRHLVAAGPAVFDFYPETPSRSSTRLATLEYLQFLRGSGVHPLGSLLQLGDAFGRVVYEPAPGPRGYHLAASWFPVPPAARPPASDCAQAPTGDPVRDGLCEVVRRGTAARALGPLLSDPSLAIYGAKTGTIDSLGEVASSRRACQAFNEAHTLADRERRPADQPYWLDCSGAQPPDDSLLLVAFGVPTPGGGVTPLTLGLRFQRAGAGFAAEASRLYIELVRDYFAPPAARRLP